MFSLSKSLFRHAFIALGICCTLATAHAQLSRSGATAVATNTSVTLSDTWGGACVSLIWKGNEFVEVNDAGRLLQFSAYGKQFTRFTSDGYNFNPAVRPVVNPNQGGDARRNPSRMLAPPTRIGSRGVYSQSVPREWFTHDWPNMDAQDGAEFTTSSFKTLAQILPGYDNKVVKFTSTFRTPTASPLWRSEIPALYLLGKYRKFYGVDAQADSIVSVIPPTNGDRVVFRPTSKIGGMIATTTTDGPTIGIYVAAASKGGIAGEGWQGLCRVFSTAVTKIGAETIDEALAANVDRVYHTHIVVGDNPTDVKNTMRTLYLNGVR